ncbi:unnamed protein product [Calypogeia fissa]
MEETGSGQLVILVVGNAEEEKKVVVDRFTSGWKKPHTTAAGVRIWTDTSGTQVVNTLPLLNVPGRSETLIARRWISKNGLRRIMLRKWVFVVCVVTKGILKVKCNSSAFSKDNCWLDLFEQMWGNYEDVVTVPITGGNGLSTASQHQLQNCLKQHKISLNMVPEDSVGTLVETIRKKGPTFCVRAEKSTCESREVTNPSLCGLLKQSRRDSFGPKKVFLRDRFEVWTPEKVILFGRTGSGKSTIAQMLTSGKLDNTATKFKASSGIRGETEKITTGEGRGWYVVDTPGFGEPESNESTVPTRLAQQKLKHFVEWMEGTYSHYLFVLKKDRVDRLDLMLWNFFKLIFAVFGTKVSHHWSVVITHADKEWLDKERSFLEEKFEGCTSFLTADFPETDDYDVEVEREYAELRTESLRDLEEGLASERRFDLASDFGKKSRMSILNDRDRGLNDEKVDTNFQKVIDFLEGLGYFGANPLIPGYGLGAHSFFTSIDNTLHYLKKLVKKDSIKLEKVDLGVD